MSLGRIPMCLTHLRRCLNPLSYELDVSVLIRYIPTNSRCGNLRKTEVIFKSVLLSDILQAIQILFTLPLHGFNDKEILNHIPTPIR